jgi:DNA replication protein DnaC
MKAIFPQYQDKTIDDFEITNPGLERAVDVSRGYITDLKAMKDRGQGITYVGPNGVGKTHLACAVMREAMGSGYRIECIELSSLIELHLEMFNVNARLKQGYEEDYERSFELDARLRYIQMKARFLLLDDLGREHESVSGWSNQRVFDLLRYRHNRCLPTIITTNLPFAELDTRYTEGLSSFLRGATTVVVMQGEDYRCGVAR